MALSDRFAATRPLLVDLALVAALAMVALGWPSRAAAQTFQEFPIPNVSPIGITAGPDGALWFGFAGNIGRINTAGVVTTLMTIV